MTLEAATFPIDRPTAYSGVGVNVSGPGSLTLTQMVGPRFYDHRGQVTMSALGAFADVAVGGPTSVARVHATGVRPQGVLSRLTASTAAPFPVAGEVTGIGRALHFDDTSGLSSAEVLDEHGNVVLHLTGRMIVVGRAPVDSVTDSAALTVDGTADPRESWVGADVLDSMAGVDIVGGIAAGSLPRGPLAEMLDLRVHSVERGAVRATVSPAEWTANLIGSIQGGVLLSIAETASSLAAQTLTDVGGHYRMLEISLDYLRSPAAPGPAVHLQSAVVRAGRRLASLETLLTGEDGTVYVRAHANVQLFIPTAGQR
ncbi:PaaI family thioesterase [Rhodococcus sp. SJ-2]